MLESKYTDIYQKIFFITLGMLAIIDSINGFLLSQYSISISALYRLIVLIVLAFFTVYKNNVKNYISIIFIVGYLIVSSALTLYNNNELNSIMYDFSKIIKFLFILVIIESYKNVYRNKHNDGLELIEKIIDYNLILFPICILVPAVLGIGLNTYDSVAGSKGFFYANNEIGLILSVLCIFAVDKLYNKVNLYNIAVFVLVFLSTLSIGSKVGMIFPFLITIVYFVKSIINKKEKSDFFKLILGILLFIIIIAFLFLRDLITNVLLRQMYFYTLYQNTAENPIITLLLSGRDKFVAIMMWNLMNSNNIIIHFLFGYSTYIKESIIGSIFFNGEGLKAIEMDFFDVFFSYGLIGTVLIYGYFIRIFIKNYSFEDRNIKYTIAFINIIVLGFLAGHVFFGAMAGSILGLVVCGMISSKNYVNTNDNSYKGDFNKMEMCNILGMNFTLGDMDSITLNIIKRIKENKKTFIITPNVDFLTRYNENKEFKDVCDKADVSIIDGMPVYWIAKAKGIKGANRIAGIDFCTNLARKSKEDNFSIFLLGGENNVANKAANILKENYNANIAGAISPKIGFEKQEESLNEVLEIINDCKPDIILAGMSSPIQENFIVNNIDKIDAKVFIGVGGTFNVISGDISRAPKLMQKLGLEWLHRVAKEPGRLASRYAKNAVDLGKLIIKSWSYKR